MYTLYHYMLEVHNLLFDFTGVTVEIALEETSDSVETVKDTRTFEVGLSIFCILLWS